MRQIPFSGLRSVVVICWLSCDFYFCLLKVAMGWVGLP